jgi:hypothetical protein
MGKAHSTRVEAPERKAISMKINRLFITVLLTIVGCAPSQTTTATTPNSTNSANLSSNATIIEKTKRTITYVDSRGNKLKIEFAGCLRSPDDKTKVACDVSWTSLSGDVVAVLSPKYMSIETSDSKKFVAYQIAGAVDSFTKDESVSFYANSSKGLFVYFSIPIDVVRGIKFNPDERFKNVAIEDSFSL